MPTYRKLQMYKSFFNRQARNQVFCFLILVHFLCPGSGSRSAFPTSGSRRVKAVWIHADPDPHYWTQRRAGGGGGGSPSNVKCLRVFITKSPFYCFPRARNARERQGAGCAQPGAAQGAGGAAEERRARPLGSTPGGALVPGGVRSPATFQVFINACLVGTGGFFYLVFPLMLTQAGIASI